MKGSLGAPDSIMLNFPTIDDYDSFFNDTTYQARIIASSNYSPLRNSIDALDALAEAGDSAGYYGSPYLADTLYEDYGLLLDIVNEKKLVRLGNYIVRVDLPTDQVFTIAASYPNAVDTILTNTANAAVTTYSRDEQLVDILFLLMKGCKDKYAANQKQKIEAKCSSKKRTKKELTYQTAGIYFSVVAEMKSQKKSWGIWWSDAQYPQISNVNFYYKFRCGNTYQYSGVPPVGLPSNTYITNSSKATFRPFQGPYALTTYNLYAKMGLCGGTQTLHIAD